MAKATLHFEHDGYGTDEIVVEADSLDELRQIAAAEVERRKPDNYWSSDVQE